MGGVGIGWACFFVGACYFGFFVFVLVFDGVVWIWFVLVVGYVGYEWWYLCVDDISFWWYGRVYVDYVVVGSGGVVVYWFGSVYLVFVLCVCDLLV